MSSTYGENLKLTIFGQSHSPAIGVTIEGIPAGEKVDLDELQRFLSRRAPGKNAWSTPRKEADAPEILSGLVNGRTCGAPLTAIIRNTNTRPQDYENLALTPRPGHADYTAEVKYGGYQDRAGGGHFSGRLTAPLCIAGGICLQILAREGIAVVSRIASIAGVCDEGELISSTADKEFPVVNDACGEKMRAAIAQAREEPRFSVSRRSRALNSARALARQSCAAARTTMLFLSKTGRSSPRRTAAAAFSAASRTECPSCCARPSSRRRPSRARSKASICRA